MSEDSGERPIFFEGREHTVTRVLDQAWAGIVFRSCDDGRLLLVWPEWRNGGYFERVREISEAELKRLRESPGR